MNTYLYQIKDGFIMIDTGYENNYTKCTSSMKRKGISWADIKYIFLTHAQRFKSNDLYKFKTEISKLILYPLK